MATFYGTISGRAKKRATQCGSKESGLRVTAQSWEGSVGVSLRMDGNRVRVAITAGEGSCDPDRLIAAGFIEDFIDCKGGLP